MDARSSLSAPLQSELFALHAAIEPEALWLATRSLLRAAVGFHRVTLFLGHLDMGDARLVYTDPPIEDWPAWFEARGRDNPFSRWIEEHLGATHYLFKDVVGPPSQFRSTDFYRDFARAEGWDKGLSCLFWHKGKGSLRAMFSIYRSPREKEFRADELELLLSLSSQIEVAVTRVQRIQREQNFRAALETFNRTMPVPLLLLDWELKIVFANQSAYESLAVWNHGPEKARAYKVRSNAWIPAELDSAIRELKAEIQRREPKSLAKRMPATRVVPNARLPGYCAHISPAHYGQRSLARPGFFVLLQEPQPPRHEEEGAQAWKLRALRELTPAERELAREACKGYSNAQLADRLSKSILTVKSQMNSIFQKLGIRSRAELIARFK